MDGHTYVWAVALYMSIKSNDAMCTLIFERLLYTLLVHIRAFYIFFHFTIIFCAAMIYRDGPQGTRCIADVCRRMREWQVQIYSPAGKKEKGRKGRKRERGGKDLKSCGLQTRCMDDTVPQVPQPLHAMQVHIAKRTALLTPSDITPGERT